ncbi:MULTISPECIES: hypothetical protein [unclassified Streptomyces]
MSAAKTPAPRPCRGHRTLHPRRQRQRRIVFNHFVRGLSYGTGLALAGLFGYWVQQLL